MRGLSDRPFPFFWIAFQEGLDWAFRLGHRGTVRFQIAAEIMTGTARNPVPDESVEAMARRGWEFELMARCNQFQSFTVVP